MKKILLFLGIPLVLIVAIVAWFYGTRNNLVTLQESVNESWAQVENVYQRRLDLIPNLVETVKGYAAHEKDTLQSVIEARSKASQINLGDALNNPENFAKFQETQSGLSSALSRLMVVVERYPDLKANQNFLQLQSQLEGTENRIAVERRRFNEVAKSYNTQIRRFPSSVVAGWSGFAARPYFQADEAAKVAPKVKF